MWNLRVSHTEAECGYLGGYLGPGDAGQSMRGDKENMCGGIADLQESRVQHFCLGQGKWCPVKKQLVAGFLSPPLPQTILPWQGAR